MSLIEKLGGIKTSYCFDNEDQKAKVVAQYLVKRASYDFYTEHMRDSGAGYGYGYEALYLEFETIGWFISTRKGRYKKGNGALELLFREEDGDLLYQHTITFRGTIDNNNSDKLRIEHRHRQGIGKYYYIELTGVPFLVLNKTATIEFRAFEGDEED